MPSTPEQDEIRAAKRRKRAEKMQELKRVESAKAEKILRRKIKKILPLLRGEEPQMLDYIHKQIDLGTRDPEDIKLLRSRRRDIIHRHLPKESTND